MNFLCWAVLGIALITGSLGIYTAVILTISILLFIVGFFLSSRAIFSPENDEFWFSVHNSHLYPTNAYLPKILECLPVEKIQELTDHRITGSHMIDEQLHIIIKYFIQDFILSWYPAISHDPRYVIQLQHCLQQTLISISNRCKNMDWVVYLTTRLVDDVATHLRLFREAKVLSRSKKDNSYKNLVDYFFDKEAEKEKDICRDEICLKAECEKDYLIDLVEMVLYFVLPNEEFVTTPIRSAVTEMLVSLVLLPLINLLSDPDYVNLLIVWGCTGIPISSELFVSVIKMTTTTEELEAIKRLLAKEISQLRSRDSGGRDEGTEVRQQIGSLEYLRQIVEARLARLSKGSETDSSDISLNLDYRKLERGRLFQLPLEAILKNSVTLDSFLRYMASVNCQHYVNLYLNIECWKTSVCERLCALELEKLHHFSKSSESDSGIHKFGIHHDYFSAHDISAHKAEAEVMYEQYLSEKANPRVNVEDSIVKRLILRLRSEKLNENWFDEVQVALFTTLKEADLFLPAFRRSVWYIRLLGELDLLKDISRSDEEDSHSLDDVDDQEGLQQGGSRGSSCTHSPQSSISSSPHHSRASSLSNRSFTMSAEISGAEIVREGNRSHAVYKVNIERQDYSGHIEIWHVFRRYSEFHDLYTTICQKFLDLSSISFPSKKMLNNLAPWFLERRMCELNEWLSRLLEPPTIQSHPGLQDYIFRFLDRTYIGMQGSANLARKVEENLVAPIRVGVRSMSDAVKAVPDTVISTVDGVVDGICRRLIRQSQDKGRCGPADYSGSTADLSGRGTVDVDSDENIPLRIMLVLMDEVFDLRSKDQWLRRRLVLFLRQILKAMFGDIVNRRIVEYVGYMTSQYQVTDYIKSFKDSIWPNGKLTAGSPHRSHDLQMRTRVTARLSMLASISDEFRAILGSQTTNRGILNVYECVQWQPLNRRLLYVLLHGIIEALLPNHRQVPSLLRSLNSNSTRITKRNEPPPRIKKSKRLVT